MWSAQFNEVIVLIIVFCFTNRAAGKPSIRNATDDLTVTEYAESDADQSYESMPMCKSKKRLINPDDLVKLSNEIIQFDQNFTQSIEVEVCENEGAPCSDEDKVLTKTSCVQRYLSIRLQVVTRNHTRSEAKTFSIPSNCECVYLKKNTKVKGH